MKCCLRNMENDSENNIIMYINTYLKQREVIFVKAVRFKKNTNQCKNILVSLNLRFVAYFSVRSTSALSE